MNNITEQALITDVGNLKAAHNNAVTQMQQDVNNLRNACRQLAAMNKQLEQRVAQLESGVQARPRTQVRTASVVQPTAPAEPVVVTPAPASIPDPSSWSHDGEEDADVVE